MRRSRAAKYARWSAALALLLAGATAAVFLERAWVRHVERKNAPPPAPVDVERQSTRISFSKVEENRTIFTVDASKSTDFRSENASLLEDVQITIFGKTGQRHDTLHTKSCRYSKADGVIACAGEVQINLLSAADAEFLEKHPEQSAARRIQVTTRGVTFQRSTGLARTDQPVTFFFPNGEGRAVGMEFSSQEGSLRLQRDVRVMLHQAPAHSGVSSHRQLDAEISGSQLDFTRDAHLLLLSGPAIAKTQQGRLTAGEFRMELDEEFRAKSLDALPGSGISEPQLTSHSRGGEQVLRADRISASFSPECLVEHLDAAGNVQGNLHAPGQSGSLVAANARLELWPRTNQPKQLTVNGAASLRLEDAPKGETRELRTDALRVSFSESKEGVPSHPLQAETLAPGTVTWTEQGTTAQSGSPIQTRIAGQKLTLDFGSLGKARRLAATDNVLMERSAPGRPLQTATARQGRTDLIAGGAWAQTQLEGDVSLKEGERTAQADHAVFQRATQTATLTGHASVRDATTETSAAKITFAQSSGDITAAGGVRSVDFTAKASAVALAPAPASVTADNLQASSKNHQALYIGHARLWQGDSVLEADRISLTRDQRVLNASGNVRAVFQQVPPSSPGTPPAQKSVLLWHVSAQALTYWDTENRAYLEHNVILQGPRERMRGESLDLYFQRSAAGAANAQAGTQQISHAVATGGVVVEMGARRATAERGEFTGSEGKFVMSGGNPTIFDAASGTTTGRQLTFFLANDTIIVDSENGSRTLTKHRVEN